MSSNQAIAALVGALLLIPPLQALARTDTWNGWRDRHEPTDRGPDNRLVEKYDRFAGSEKNARELVEGLRNDSRIELSKGGKTTTFAPATGKMGWGNVDHALALAKASLAKHGIHNPTPEQIRAALNGGTITTKSGGRVTLPGVLNLRASGMGWGEIAHKTGTKLGHEHGDRKYHDERHHPKHAHRPDAKHDRVEWKHHERPDFHRAKFERPGRPEKIERPEKFERPQRPERPERPHRGR